MRQVARTAAIVSLLLGSLLPADCCQAARRAAADPVADNVSCCQQPAAVFPAAVLDEPCGAACCGAFGPSHSEEPGDEHRCRCQLQPRDSQLFLAAPRLTVAPDDTVMTAAVDGVDLVSPQQPPIASVPGTGPPRRPVRVLYGVWRN